jgi:hypothetical protein
MDTPVTPYNDSKKGVYYRQTDYAGFFRRMVMHTTNNENLPTFQLSNFLTYLRRSRHELPHTTN